MSERRTRAEATAREIFGFVPPLGHEEGEPVAAAELRELMFTQAFAESWTRTSLDSRTRSLITVAMLAATGDFDEMKGHVAGALSLGVTPDELVDLFAHVSAYMGTSKAVPGWNVASRVIKKVGARRPAEEPVSG